MASSLDILLHMDLVVVVVDMGMLARQATPAVDRLLLMRHQSLLV